MSAGLASWSLNALGLSGRDLEYTEKTGKHSGEELKQHESLVCEGHLHTEQEDDVAEMKGMLSTRAQFLGFG
jgi:hypothetical protein